MSPRAATTAVFFVNGAVIGTWVAQIPWIKERFDLSNGAMGLVLLGMSATVVLGTAVAGHLVARRGSGRVSRLGGVACALAVNLPVLAPAPGLVVLGLMVLGAASAAMDVGMNTHGSHVEQARGRPIMSSLHAGWAFGGFAGSGLAALLVGLDLDPRAAVAVASALLLVAVLAVTPRMGPGSAAEPTPFALPSRAVVALALMCFVTMVIEGAMADWSGIYLREDLDSGAAVAALGFAAFTAGMTAGRVTGDAVNARLGPQRLLRGGALLTIAALVVMLVVGLPGVALVALVAIGLGVANAVPLMYSAAGRQTPPGPSIGAVSSMGSIGFIAGPPVIGFLAQATSLPWALGVLVLGAGAVLALAHRV